MIKYKKNIRYEISEGTWELLTPAQRAEFTDEGGSEIEIKEIPLAKSDLPKHDIEIIDISLKKEEIKEETKDEVQEIKLKPGRTKKVKDESTTQKDK